MDLRRTLRREVRHAPAAAAVCNKLLPSSSLCFTSRFSKSAAGYSEKYATFPSEAFSSIGAGVMRE